MIKYFPAAALALALIVTGVASAFAAQYKLQVDGLACPFCAYGIEKQLKKTSGVKKIGVDLDAGIVTVTMAKNTRMSKSQAGLIVKKAGFTLRGFTKSK